MTSGSSRTKWVWHRVFRPGVAEKLVSDIRQAVTKKLRKSILK